jgi:predicted metalloprotease with PDZ domain
MTNGFRKRLTRTLAAAVILTSAATAQNSSNPVMSVVVDETQAPRRIAFVHEEIQVKPGALSLAYPKWIPGEHGPTGPIQEFAMLRIHAGDTILAWTRDPEEIFTIHVDVPAKVEKISVDFNALLVNTISDQQMLVAWNTVLLYPLGIDKRELMIAPSLVVPPNWKQGSSLQVTSQTGDRVNFAPTSLERLIDSPVLASEYFRSVKLTSVWPAQLEITGDSQAAVDKADDAHAFTLFGKLIDQDRAMFGYRHWQTLHLLISQSEAMPFDGLEHEDSPWDAVGDAGLSKKDVLEKFGWPLLAHEQSHSWDGKYRRPAELYSKPDYQGPERTSLLWVYEGLNEYIGMLLATRAGFNDAEYMQDYLAQTAANFAAEPARAATPLVDTATEDWVLRTTDPGWYSLRRGQDYYDEGALIWLRADAIIREQTKDQKSLDDFLRSFLGQHDTPPIVVGYTREDVEAALDAVCPYDWHSFFETRIYQVNSKPPTDGLEAAGWRMVYNSTPNHDPFYSELLGGGLYNAWYSIGLYTKKGGGIGDVLQGSPAYTAGLGPHMTILAVNGRVYSSDVFDEAIAHPRNGKISLIVKNFDSVETHEIQYSGGIRYPHLERIPGSHDYLSEILAPREYKEH